MLWEHLAAVTVKPHTVATITQPIKVLSLSSLGRFRDAAFMVEYDEKVS